MELAKCNEALRTQVRHGVARPTPAATQHTHHHMPTLTISLWPALWTS